jgi:hypothetical protein
MSELPVKIYIYGIENIGAFYIFIIFMQKNTTGE